MAKSLHETRNPMEVTAKVNACEILDLDYTLSRFTADDGESTFKLEIPELGMERLLAPRQQAAHVQAKPKSQRLTIKDMLGK